MKADLLFSPSIFVLSRYIAVGIAAGEAFLFAYILGVDSYGQYAVIMQIANSLVMLGFGNASGYIYAFYKNSLGDNNEVYKLVSLLQYLIGAGVLALALLIAKPQFLASIFIFLIQVPYLITEPLFRVKNMFVVPVIGKGMGSLMTILLISIFYFSQVNAESGRISINTSIMIVLFGNFLGYGIYYLSIFWVRGVKVESLIDFLSLKALIIRDRVVNYWFSIQKPGILISSSSLVFMFFMNVDRLFIEHFHRPEILSVYSLAWQLSQGACLLLTSLNLMSNIRIGQKISGSSTDKELTRLLKKELLITFYTGFSVFVALVCASYILSKLIYKDYYDLVRITALVGGGYLSIYIASAVTGLLTYEGHNLGLVISWAIALCMSLGFNLLSIRYDLWYGNAVAMTSFILILQSLWLIAYTYLALKKRKCNYITMTNGYIYKT